MYRHDFSVIRMVKISNISSQILSIFTGKFLIFSIAILITLWYNIIKIKKDAKTAKHNMKCKKGHDHMKTTNYHVNSIPAAWAKVNDVLPTEYSKDENSSARAGYPVFRSSDEYYNYICDLGDRLEVNLENGETINIWIDATEETEAAAEMPEKENSEEYIEILLIAKESGETKQFDKYEEFIENWRFWFAAGKPYISDEETFAKMVESLKAFYVDGASLKILLNGLYVIMIFHRWK